MSEEVLADSHEKINHPFVVWSTCFLWLISLFAITFSLVMFFCIGDILTITGTDLINAVVFLIGILMLLTSLQMMYSIALNQEIRTDSKVSCCPIWMCTFSIIAISMIGCGLCMHKMWHSSKNIQQQILESMANYSSSYRHKRFIDNMQWSLKCCGLNSYRDWFTRNWHDKTQDLVVGSNPRKRTVKNWDFTDSVPFSCCKSGSCISNYLTELGTFSVNTKGCGNFMQHILMVAMSLLVSMFLLIILMQFIILFHIMPLRKKGECRKDSADYDVRQLLNVRDNFRPSSESYMALNDESEEEFTRNYVYENY